jgi:hypothetical protein
MCTSLHQKSTALLLSAALLLLLLPAHVLHSAEISPDGIWDDVDSSAVMRTAQSRQIVPRQFRTLQINRRSLEQALQAAPMENAGPLQRSAATIWLPLPDGSFGEFRIVESPIMEPALAQRFPEIRTWLGQGIDDPTATLRFDLTPKGFHAQIISAHGTHYIDPYQPGDIDHYIAYARHDLVRAERMRCEVTGEELGDDDLHLHDHSGDLQLSSGATLRTYRLAVAATGEYTVFHGGTVADGLAGIVTTMNRVNGIYEREVSVRMVLVANNDAIIYTNPATDPYANTSNDLNANQSNINAVIGSANYDIGHLVGTGGGGVAGLGVVCNNTSKARGLTGSGAPIGDPFDVDYVAHEIGHQFRGNHTFNGSGGNCSGSNRNASTAYEPGSGITIQAYAGICGADNLQPNSEDYFHRVSLNEIIAFTTTGTGASCGTTSTTGNTPPTVTTTSAVTIPQRTPFELVAVGSDANGDAITYLWEQFNLGSANTAGSLADNGGPLFRSFIPRLDGTRTVPSLRYILDNANVAPATAPLPGTTSPNWFTAELLPSTNRTMNFRVTVRDNRAGGGGTNEAASAVTVTTSAGPFVVTAPNTAVSWAAGTQQTVSWDVAGTNAGTVNVANVRIRLSLDGGYTWPVELAASTPNNGAALVTIPAATPSTTRARVRVEAVGSIWFDVSNVNFTISGGSNSPPVINVTGSVSTRQGSPTASAVVATVSDGQDVAGTLAVSVGDLPHELQVEVSNTAGSVTLAATASCTLVAPRTGNKTYPVRLHATDSAGASSSAFVNVLVASNLTPTLGNYANLQVVRGAAPTHAPSAAPADGNNNLDGISVTPATLPGGGSLSVALPGGEVSIQTTGGTTPGTYPVRVLLSDNCGATEARDFQLTVTSPVAGVTVTETGGATNVAEGGAVDSYSVVLTSQPSADVQITMTPVANVGVSPASLAFTAANWNVPQVVVVSAVDDRIVEGPHTGTISHSASGGGYTGVAIADVVASVTDNDSAAYQFTTASSSHDEAGGSAVIAVSLQFDTSGTGPIALASPISVPVSVAAGSTAIDGIHYSLPASNVVFPVGGGTQAFVVTLLDNAIADGDRTLLLALGTATGGGAGMSSAVVAGTPATHTLAILDNDVAGVVIVQPGGSTHVVEGGASASYTIELRSQPTADVLITITPDDQLSVAPTQLVFTAANWNMAQTVTVTAIDDDDDEGDHTGTISHVASGGGYAGVSIADVVVNITDTHLVADVAVSTLLLTAPVLAGRSVAFEVTINNLATAVDVPEVGFDFSVQPALGNVQWTCTATAGATCPASGSGVPVHDIALARESGVLYSITADITADSPVGTGFVATATVQVAAPIVDPNPTNDSDSATATVTTVEVFRDGFEAPTPGTAVVVFRDGFEALTP